MLLLQKTAMGVLVISSDSALCPTRLCFSAVMSLYNRISDTLIPGLFSWRLFSLFSSTLTFLVYLCSASEFRMELRAFYSRCSADDGFRYAPCLFYSLVSDNEVFLCLCRRFILCRSGSSVLPSQVQNVILALCARSFNF